MTHILSGRELADQVQAALRARIAELKEAGNRSPGLGVLLVGDNPASLSYIKRKEKVAEACGIRPFDKRLPDAASAEQVRDVIREWNASSEVDGILMQLPLPKGLDSDALLAEIAPEKDADGLHILNQGHLFSGSTDGVPVACTPRGAMALIDLAMASEPGEELKYHWPLPAADLSGKRAVVIGRSRLVGKPLAMLLLERNATVTICHSRTKNIAEVCQQADILVAAVGREKMVQGDWVKRGAVVIDVGINRGEDGKLYGDIEYNACAEKSSAITPVPGGVGPMTVAMLLWNTFEIFLKREGLQ